MLYTEKLCCNGNANRPHPGLLNCVTPNQPRPHVYGKGPLDLVYLDDMRKAKSFVLCCVAQGPEAFASTMVKWKGRWQIAHSCNLGWDRVQTVQCSSYTVCFVSKWICIARYCLFKVSFVLLFHGNGQELFLFYERAWKSNECHYHTCKW